MLDLIFAPLEWIEAHVGLEAAFGFAVMLAVAFAVVVVLQMRRAAAVRTWYDRQFEEFRREEETLRAKKGSAEGDAERWAKMNDELRNENMRLRNQVVDLRAGLLVPDGARHAVVVENF